MQRSLPTPAGFFSPSSKFSLRFDEDFNEFPLVLHIELPIGRNNKQIVYDIIHPIGIDYIRSEKLRLEYLNMLSYSIPIGFLIVILILTYSIRIKHLIMRKKIIFYHHNTVFRCAFDAKIH